jgi:non-specific serine/threonine protein kinase
MYFVSSGNLATARHCAEQVLQSDDGDVAERFRARCANVYVAALLGDEHVAAGLLDGLRADAPAVAHDPAARAALAHGDGVVRLFSGDLENAVDLVAAAVDDACAAGLTTEELNLRMLLAMLRTAQKDPSGTDDALSALLARCEELGDGYARSYGLWVAGRRARDTGDLDRATGWELDALALKWPLRDLAGLGVVLETLAAIADDRGDTLQRARLLGAASRLWRRVAPSPVTRAYSRAQHDLMARMTRGEVDEAFVRAYREGAAAEVEDTVADLLERRGAPGPRATDRLSPREHEVAALVGEGLTNQQIANRLVISVRTVHGHMENILRKLGFASRAQVAAWVTRRELSPPASGS